MQFPFNPRNVVAYFKGSEHQPHLGDKPRKFPGKFSLRFSSFDEVQQLFCNEIIECSFQPIALLNTLRGFILFKPYLVPFSSGHNWGSIVGQGPIAVSGFF